VAPTNSRAWPLERFCNARFRFAPKTDFLYARPRADFPQPAPMASTSENNMMRSAMKSSVLQLLLGASFAGALALTPACTMGTEGGEPEGTPEGGEPDAEPAYLTDDEIIEMVEDYAAGGHTEMSDADFTSDHGGATVAVFINDGAVSDYDAIDTVAVTGPTFAEGTMIIKQHKDGVDGNNTAVTVMYKQADGYSDTGNWWWARIEDDGTRTVVSDNPTGCLGCHNSVSGSDYVYGIE